MINGTPGQQSYITHVREVALLSGERISRVFCPDRGLTQEPPVRGQLLIITNQRILSFSRDDDRNETYLVPIEELKGVAVKTGDRSYGALFQGLLLIIGGIFLYLVLAYWLTGQFTGPSVPVLNMDTGPLMVLIMVLIGLVLIVRYYFARDDGSVIFQGSSWVFAFPYRSDRARQEIYQVVNSVFAGRQARNGYPEPPKDEPLPPDL